MPKKNKSTEPFREVVPGLLVAQDFKVTIPHPDPCFVISDKQDKNSWSVDKSLAVFSSEQRALTYIKKTNLADTMVKSYSWNDLIKKFANKFADCLVDPKGEEGYLDVVPLVMEI